MINEQHQPNQETSNAGAAPIGGDAINLGNISQAQGVAVGQSASAQVVEGHSNTIAASGGIAITINPTNPPIMSTHPFMAPELPPDFVSRPTEFAQIITLLLDQQFASVAISTVLRGTGGFGKTTLATAVCHDPDVRAVFSDGILWVTLGERPSSNDLTAYMADLID